MCPQEYEQWAIAEVFNYISLEGLREGGACAHD